ncbi:hypothetical protein Q5O14_14995 [Eubacteriaceae bacterium ES2]|nr:hypothetical protein Q5O14_14995 [Eubacteriaceae bacterium ES2]
MSKIKRIFEKYTENKMAIVLIEREIELLKEEFEPSYTSHLSHTPIVHNGGSSTERTAIRNLEDEGILELQRKKKVVEADIEVVDRFIPIMSPEVQGIIQDRYFNKMTWKTIAEKTELDERTVKKRIDKALNELETAFNFSGRSTL